ncbi:MAG: ABC transporter permease [Alphaproteobacteria bacterium]|nr:ABC transporter permease [Alphaproteobacteria bacterium]
MKYLPLVWAAIMRKPARAILTLLSVMVAFTLFGLTIGLNATFVKFSEMARADRIWTQQRFGGGGPSGGGMPRALVEQIGRIPGVSQVAGMGFVGGYHGDPKNRVFIWMVDDKLGKVFNEWEITPQQWDKVRANRRGLLISKIQAGRWHLKPGDNFTMTAPGLKKADGTNSWTFQVLEVTNEISFATDGFMMGNYDFYDKSRPLADQSRMVQMFIQTSNPDQSAALAQRIDATYASSATPLQSTTEKAALDVSNNGLDFITVDREIALAGMFMVLFLTANGIAQAVRERFAEFATLKTIGFSDWGVIGLVFAEAALPCILGAILGVGLAGLIAAMVPRVGQGIGGFPMPTVTGGVVLWAMLCAAIVALISSALPALRLKRMDIATALSGR